MAALMADLGIMERALQLLSAAGRRAGKQQAANRPPISVEFLIPQLPAIYTFASGASATASAGICSGKSRRATPIRLSAIP